MNQFDFVGGVEVKEAARRVVKDTRPSVAEQKANLCLELGRLALKVPPSINSAGIEKTRQWAEASKTGLALAKNTRATVQQLSSAISALRKFL